MIIFPSPANSQREFAPNTQYCEFQAEFAVNSRCERIRSELGEFKLTSLRICIPMWHVNASHRPCQQTHAPEYKIPKWLQQKKYVSCSFANILNMFSAGAFCDTQLHPTSCACCRGCDCRTTLGTSFRTIHRT